ncbi:hypothetical protein HDU97_006411 [Phlyctochytrium planicorne]|nr:hypothetical protein HDU97_006411 [Phlyctochytrium planicorne]
MLVQIDSQAEGLRDNAVRLKGAKNYLAAATAFTDAARQFSQCGASHRLDAARCFQDSSIMFKLAGEIQRSEDSLMQAASIFEEIPNVEVQAAKIYEDLSERFQKRGDDENALKHLERAKDLFERIGDGRSVHIEMKQCDMLCQMHRFTQAFNSLTMLLRRLDEIPALKFSYNKYALSCGIAALGIPDLVSLERSIDSNEQNPLFRDSWESKALKSLLQFMRDEDMDGLDSEISNITRSQREVWYEEAFRRAKVS